MYFSKTILAAVVGFASAANIQVVTVSSANNSLTYSPDNIQAAVGDMVQFQFVAGNHTVTQSTFDQPCQPISLFSTNVTGFHSGYMPVSAAKNATGGGATIPTYTVQINSTAPVWVYCAQARHCENGMVMVINENTAANASRSLAQFKALAASATTIVPGSAAAAAEASNTTASTNSSTTTAGIIVATGLTAGAGMVQVGGYLGLAGLLAAVFII